MATLNETPGANRLHIGIFGRTNSGKSTLLNAFAGQEVSIVSNISGTTTDPVRKAMEIAPLGPCVLIDTAGVGDETPLGEARLNQTRKEADKTDIAIIVISAGTSGTGAEYMEGCNPETMETSTCEVPAYSEEVHWIKFFEEKKKPYAVVFNHIEETARDFFNTSIEQEQFLKAVSEKIGEKTAESLSVVHLNAATGAGLETLKSVLVSLIPEDFGVASLTGNLVSEGDTVLLVMPQDIQAPKGRLILPQVQTIRELLDKKCLVLCVTTDQCAAMLEALVAPPKLIITDSQVFDVVYRLKPEESMLTSFSILMAANKGDLDYYLAGAEIIDSLNNESRVLIAECCTHAPMEEDIGRVKIPAMLRKKYGADLQVDVVSGTDFPENPEQYDLIIQCGACMFNRTYVMSRIETARTHGVPMTNYGVAIAHLTGILDKISVR